MTRTYGLVSDWMKMIASQSHAAIEMIGDDMMNKHDDYVLYAPMRMHKRLVRCNTHLNLGLARHARPVTKLGGGIFTALPIARGYGRPNRKG